MRQIYRWSLDVGREVRCLEGWNSRATAYLKIAWTYSASGQSVACPLQSTPRDGVNKDGSIRYRARQQDCQSCALRQRCTPNMPARKVARSIHEGARDLARDIATADAYLVSRRQRKKVEMLFAHLKRILKLDRLRLRGPMAQEMSSTSPLRPRTSAKWPRSYPWRDPRWPDQQRGPLASIAEFRLSAQPTFSTE